MITPEEREEIINAAVEKALLVLPETVGSLITGHMALSKLNTQFYKDYPEFKDRKDIVASIIEKIDGENPALDYKDILGKAVPEIRRRIETVDSLNMKSVSSNPSRTYEPLTVPKIDNRHGEL
jgi:hypothetical protein